MDPVKIQIFGISGIILLWIVTLTALGVFGYKIIKLISLFRQAKPENRFDQPKKRIQNFIIYVLGQKRLFNERSIGLAHFLFFWGFVFYASTFWWALIRGLFPIQAIPYPDEIGIITLLLEVFAVLVLVSIVAAIARRILYPPPHLHISGDAYIILGLISILMISFVLQQGFLLTAEKTIGSIWNPVGNLIAAIIQSIPLLSQSAHDLNILMWWIHIITVLVFLAYLPFSKHMHLLVSPFNVYFGNLRPAGDLGIAGSGDDVTSGVSQWKEFTWRQLLNGFACAECGRCDRVCPALNSGYNLSPQDMVQHVKEYFLDSGFKSHNGNPQPDTGKQLIDGYVTQSELWSCTTCYACMERCAVLNEHLPLIIQMRRSLVNQGKVESTIQDTLTYLSRYGNSFGKSDRMRAKWTQGLEFKIKDARKEEVEYLWYVGDYASYDPRVQEITKSTAQIFQKAGLNFGILYEGERNAGNDIRRIGEEGLFQMLKDKNIAVLEKSKFQKIVTTDPHTYNTLKNEYTTNGSNLKPEQVIHYTELIDQLIHSKQLNIKPKSMIENSKIKVTYQDPCYLGRYNGVYEPPRRILKALGVHLEEMPRNRATSYCCGAGGGRIWMEDQPGIKERPSENRIREALSLSGVEYFMVSCPKDIVMFQDAVKTTGNEGKIIVKDISELVLEAI